MCRDQGRFATRLGKHALSKAFYGKGFLAQDSGQRDACEKETKDIALFKKKKNQLFFTFWIHI